MQFYIVQLGNLFKIDFVAQLSKSHLFDCKNVLIYSKVEQSYSHMLGINNTVVFKL